MNAITKDFGSLENLQTALSAKAVAVQGSGWAWLVCTPILKNVQ